MPVVTGLTDQLVIKYFHLGWSDQEIAEQYGITPQAVSKRRVRLGLRKKPVATQVNEYLAARWDIYQTQGTDSHHNRYSAKRLKEWLRWRLGDEALSEDQLHRAKVWEERLRREATVLCYDRDRPEPWYYRPRLKRDGNLVIDWPEGLEFPDEKLKKALELSPEPNK